jgi:hypothetical protein
MATGAWPTIVDVTSRMDGAGRQMTVAELLSQCNDIWDYLPVKEGNEFGGHEFSYRTSLPAGFWRSINQGTPFGKSTTAKSRLGTGTLEDWSQVDCLLAEASGDIESFRSSEMVSFMEGMSQTMAQTVFYGNSAATPASFNGLSTFYNTVSLGNAQNAANVIDGQGTGSNNLSMWLNCYSPRSFYAVYPRGTKAGLTVEDLDKEWPAFDAVGNPFRAYTFWFRHLMAVIPEDWRFISRLANVDVTAAGLAGPNAADLFSLMAEMVMLPPLLSKQTSGITQTDAPTEEGLGVRPAFHVNRTGRHWLDVQGMRGRNVLLSVTDSAGIVTDRFRGIPVTVVDQLLTTEARVV